MNKSVASEYIWNPRICFDMLAFKLIFESLQFGEQIGGSCVIITYQQPENGR